MQCLYIAKLQEKAAAIVVQNKNDVATSLVVLR